MGHPRPALKPLIYNGLVAVEEIKRATAEHTYFRHRNKPAHKAGGASITHPQPLCEIRHAPPSLLLLQWLGLSYSYSIHPPCSGLTALSTESETMTWLGNKLVISAQNELIAEQAKARGAGNEAISIANDSINSLKSQLRRAKDDAYEAERALSKERSSKQALQKQNEQLINESQQWKEAIAERDSLILEWMVTNEGFRRLAREYGKKIGVSDEQRQADFDNHVLDIVEEDKNLENTKSHQKAKQRLGR